VKFNNFKLNFKSINLDYKMIGISLIGICFIVGMLKFGYPKYTSIKNQLKSLSTQEQSLQGKVSSYSNQNNILQLNDLKQQWGIVSQQYGVDVEDGYFYSLLGSIAEKDGVKDITISDEGTVTNFYENHLESIIYNLVIKSSFSEVVNLLSDLENAGVPLEIKPIQITSSTDNPKDVETSCDVVLYSTNPPTINKMQFGNTGRYDLFYDSEFVNLTNNSTSSNSSVSNNSGVNNNSVVSNNSGASSNLGVSNSTENVVNIMQNLIN